MAKKGSSPTKPAKEPKAKKGVDYELDLSVAFKGLSIGLETARLGVTITRSQLPLMLADEKLNGRRLVATIESYPSGEQPGQKHLLESPELAKIGTAFDVKGLNVKHDTIGFGLTCNLKEVDVSQLSLFAQRTGRLCIVETAPIPEEEKSKDEHGDAE